MANSVITDTARLKLAKARSTAKDGFSTENSIYAKYIAFGDGGVDSSGAVILALRTQTSLNHELIRKEIETRTLVDEKGKYRYEVTLEDSDIPDTYISEMALCDENGDLIAIQNFSAKSKTGDMQVTFVVYDDFSI